MDKHLLIVNATSESNLPNFIVAKKMGLFVTLVGPEFPSWVRPYVNNYLEADNYNVTELVNIIRKYNEKNKIDGVITFWDREVKAVAAIAHALNLPGNSPEAALISKHKGEMRKILQKSNVSQPEFYSIKNEFDLYEAAKKIGYPLILKPTGASASQGIFLIDNKDQIHKAFNEMELALKPTYWFDQHEYLAEAYMRGIEFSVEGIVQESQDIFFAGITKKWTDQKYFAEQQHCFPTDLKQDEINSIYALVEKAITAIGLRYSAFHTEVMKTEKTFKIVEVNARLGGDLITTQLVPLATGFSIVEAAIKTSFGMPICIEPYLKKEYACIRFLIENNMGTVAWKNISVLEELKKSGGIVDFGLLKANGELVLTPPKKFGDNRLCYVITKAATEAEATEHAISALNKLEYKIV